MLTFIIIKKSDVGSYYVSMCKSAENVSTNNKHQNLSICSYNVNGRQISILSFIYSFIFIFIFI